MSDTNDTQFEPDATAPVDEPSVPTPSESFTPSPESSPAAESITEPGIAAPENALVGDANQPAPREPEAIVNTEAVPAQTTGKPSKEVEEVYVHETTVTLDTVITDPHSPEAVQIPDAGRGSLVLPIHGLDAPTVEQVFAKASE